MIVWRVVFLAFAFALVGIVRIQLTVYEREMRLMHKHRAAAWGEIGIVICTGLMIGLALGCLAALV